MKMSSIFLSILTMAFSTQIQAYIGGSKFEIPSTVRIISPFGEGCSAVKVGDQFLLTAAHCTLNGEINEGMRLSLADSTGTIKNTQERVLVKKIYIPDPLYNFPIEIVLDESAEAEASMDDLAILEIAGDLSQFKTSQIDLRPIEKNETILVVGFGCKGQNYPTYPFLTGATKLVSETSLNTFDVGIIDSDELKMSIGCPGDSGGPVYKKSPEGNLLVVGINRSVNLHEKNISINPVTGNIESYKAEYSPESNSAYHRIARLGFSKNQDPLNIMNWLKKILPATSFFNH